MDAIRLAKKRASHRRHQGGAVMFVVAMTLVVLASVGVYALAAASTEIKTSGNERQNTQTHSLSMYGILGATHELQTLKAATYLKLMLTQSDLCPMPVPGVTQSTDIMLRACRRLPSTELGSNWASKPPTVPYAGNTPFQSTADPGSLGWTPMNADFFVEVTAPISWQKAAGYGDNPCFCQFTVTAMGITQPSYPWAAAADSPAAFCAEGL